MAKVAAYRRPRTVEEALGLLREPHAVVLAGGTRLNGEPTSDPVVLVDLQALGLDRIERGHDDALRIGAMSTLQQLAADADVPVAVRDAARRLEPSTLRAAATVGGCVATAEPTNELLAALLVHDAVVELAGSRGRETVPLAAVLLDLSLLDGRLVTAVTIDLGGVTSAARVARTRADRPIVAAVARRAHDGVRLALCGVADAPVLVTDVDDLDPPGDFRGSSEYRRSVAATLAGRVLEAVR